MNDQSQGVPAFLSKLWALVEDPGSDYMICWDAVCKIVTCWGSHRNVYQHLRWGVTHKENMQFLLTPEPYFKSHGWLYAHILPCKASKHTKLGCWNCNRVRFLPIRCMKREAE